MTVALTTVAAPCLAADGSSACAASPKRVGACFSVRGRLAVWNGAPAFRISLIGTKRILGINDADGDPASATAIPEAVIRARTTNFTQVYGDYRVCPLSAARPGRMQFVCIDRASNLSPREP
jgi:hypothetical protein